MRLQLFIAFALFGIISCSNPEEESNDPDAFEGDMILTPAQREAAMKGEIVDAPIGRGSIKTNRWPGGVLVFTINSDLARNSRAMAAIKAGMEEWTSKTCIRFRLRSGNERAYAYFRSGSGCSSYVGRTGGSQPITLAPGCWSRGIVAHEIGHALGLYHEQSRPDRDNYVTIHWGNIQTSSKFNFNKYGRDRIDSLGTPYDYGSVMHYSGRSFSKNGRPTITAKRSGVSLGQRRGLSTIDAQQMNLMYKGICNVDPGVIPTFPPLPPTVCKDRNPLCPVMGLLCGMSHFKDKCPKTCKQC